MDLWHGIIKQTQPTSDTNLNSSPGFVVLSSVWQTQMTSSYNADKTGIFLLLHYQYVFLTTGLLCYFSALAIYWKGLTSGTYSVQ